MREVFCVAVREGLVYSKCSAVHLFHKVSVVLYSYPAHYLHKIASVNIVWERVYAIPYPFYVDLLGNPFNCYVVGEKM